MEGVHGQGAAVRVRPAPQLAHPSSKSVRFYEFQQPFQLLELPGSFIYKAYIHLFSLNYVGFVNWRH